MDLPSPPPPPPTNGMNPSILIIVLILTIVFLLSAGIHILLRFLDRRRLLRLPSSASSESARPSPAFSIRRVSPEDAPAKSEADRLPAFTFSAVFPGGSKDCSVCLAQFEGDDQLRLLPACAHAFHAACIDAWLATNLTCPLCRASIRLTADDLASLPSSRSGSFRIEMGSVSRRRLPDSAGDSSRRRSYSVGSFEYVLDDDLELAPPPPMTTAAGSLVREEGAKEPGPEPPGEGVAEAAGGRGWLREYVDRLASSASASASSLSSRTMSFRFTGRLAGGSRRSSGSWDLEGNSEGQDGNFSNFFRWLAGL